jgi:hypothetical protein
MVLSSAERRAAPAARHAQPLAVPRSVLHRGVGGGVCALRRDACDVSLPHALHPGRAGYSPLQAGVGFLPVTLLAFLVAPIAGKLSDRVPARALLGIGLITVGTGLVLMRGIERLESTRRSPTWRRGRRARSATRSPRARRSGPSPRCRHSSPRAGRGRGKSGVRLGTQRDPPDRRADRIRRRRPRAAAGAQARLRPGARRATGPAGGGGRDAAPG